MSPSRSHSRCRSHPPSPRKPWGALATLPPPLWATLLLRLTLLLALSPLTLHLPLPLPLWATLRLPLTLPLALWATLLTLRLTLSLLPTLWRPPL